MAPMPFPRGRRVLLSVLIGLLALACLPTPAVAAEETAAASRTETRDRARRGLAGTIATSARGLLGASADIAATRKSLLGE